MLSYASSRYRNGQTMVTRPSRFLRDIDPQYLKMIQGSDLDDAPRGVNPLENYRASYHSSGSASGLFNPPRRPAYAASKGEGASASWLEKSRRKLEETVASKNTPGDLTDADFTLHDVSELYGGMKIIHGRFGHGTIEDIDDNAAGAKITVTFTGAERKILLLKFARFKILSD
jgi:DNA helicase II / ATP-dependent DNA helicase PcrA